MVLPVSLSRGKLSLFPGSPLLGWGPSISREKSAKRSQKPEGVLGSSEKRRSWREESNQEGRNQRRGQAQASPQEHFQKRHFPLWASSFNRLSFKQQWSPLREESKWPSSSSGPGSTWSPASLTRRPWTKSSRASHQVNPTASEPVWRGNGEKSWDLTSCQLVAWFSLEFLDWETGITKKEITKGAKKQKKTK